MWSDPDERFFMGVSRSRNGQYVLLSSNSKRTSEVRILSTSNLTAEPHAVLPRQEGVEYSVAVGTDGFFVRVNEDAQTSSFCICHRVAHAPSFFPTVTMSCSIRCPPFQIMLWFTSDSTGFHGFVFTILRPTSGLRRNTRTLSTTSLMIAIQF